MLLIAVRMIAYPFVAKPKVVPMKERDRIACAATPSPNHDAIGETVVLAGLQTDQNQRTRAEEVLQSVTSKAAGKHRRKVYIEVAVIVLLAVLVFIVGDYTDCFLPAFRYIAEEPQHTFTDMHADEAAGTLVFVCLAMIVFSYRRWRDSKEEVVSQKNISKALRGLNEEMESRVRQRTAELGALNGTLRGEIVERKQVEAAIRQFAEIVDSTDDAIISQTHDEIITSWNPAAERMFGYSASEIIGMPIGMLIPPGHIDESREMRAWVLNGRRVSNFEKVMLHKDGHAIQVSATISPLRDEHGTIVGVSKIVRDVTEHKAAEDSLKLFRTLIDRTSDGIEVIDPETGRFLDVNATVCERLGYSREEMLSMTVSDATAGGITPERWRASMEGLRSTGYRIMETRHRRKDGSTFPTETTIRYSELNRSYIVAVVRDITERKKADQHLKLISSALEAAANAFVITDRSGVIEWVNTAFTTLTGYSCAEVNGLNPRVLNSGTHDRAYFKNLWDTINAGNVWQGEIINRRKDGKLYTEDMTVTPVRDELNEITHFIAVKQDITARKLLEAQFLRAQRMESVGTLAGGIAHDLNNVLGPILMAAEVLQDEVKDVQGRKMLKVLEASARHGADLVRQVLAFARGVEGKRILLNPVHILHELENVIRDTFPKNIDFNLDARRDIWSVEADPTQLNQVFTNLCVNARDAMPNGGGLNLAIENVVLDEMYADMNTDAAPGDYVMITVEDTGSGIPADIRDKIFEPFFTTKEIGKGTGLGLSTTAGIVRSHGGFIRVYSEMGKGTSFKVYLHANSSKEAEEAAGEVTPLPRGNGETVLVVDDEERMRAAVQSTLERFGYRVMLANNGAEAVASYVQNREGIAIVLTDMAMPIMDGPATIVALKALNPKVKIIASGGLATESDTARVIEAGVKQFVPKPYTAETLLTALAEALQQPG
jgi:PAS domain S-box-containing protein